jgi:ATP-binding cassette subfamily G (WHITE) protein 2
MITNKGQVYPTVKEDHIDEMKIDQGSTITFKSISYCIDTQNCCSACQLPCLKKTRKQVLTDLTGIFKPGMNAIMGPTGSGKSSLLDLLADRKDRRGFEGEILLNGQFRTEDYKYRVGYVVQEDIISGTLTVKENLMFSANVRLLTKLSFQSEMNIVNEVILQLGLEKCADSIVGTDFKRGVSGGERKRTNIEMELVLSPVVLFLDEPTTGKIIF